MKVRVLFFGATADAVGEREVELPILDRDTASDLVNRLTADYPALMNHKLLLAINEEYVSPGTGLRDGDNLAVFTAVSGG